MRSADVKAPYHRFFDESQRQPVGPSRRAVLLVFGAVLLAATVVAVVLAVVLSGQSAGDNDGGDIYARSQLQSGKAVPRDDLLRWLGATADASSLQLYASGAPFADFFGKLFARHSGSLLLEDAAVLSVSGPTRSVADWLAANCSAAACSETAGLAVSADLIAVQLSGRITALGAVSAPVVVTFYCLPTNANAFHLIFELSLQANWSPLTSLPFLSSFFLSPSSSKSSSWLSSVELTSAGVLSLSSSAQPVRYRSRLTPPGSAALLYAGPQFRFGDVQVEQMAALGSLQLLADGQRSWSVSLTGYLSFAQPLRHSTFNVTLSARDEPASDCAAAGNASLAQVLPAGTPAPELRRLRASLTSLSARPSIAVAATVALPLLSPFGNRSASTVFLLCLQGQIHPAKADDAPSTLLELSARLPSFSLGLPWLNVSDVLLTAELPDSLEGLRFRFDAQARLALPGLSSRALRVRADYDRRRFSLAGSGLTVDSLIDVLRQLVDPDMDAQLAQRTASYLPANKGLFFALSTGPGMVSLQPNNQLSNSHLSPSDNQLSTSHLSPSDSQLSTNHLSPSNNQLAKSPTLRNSHFLFVDRGLTLSSSELLSLGDLLGPARDFLPQLDVLPKFRVAATLPIFGGDFANGLLLQVQVPGGGQGLSLPFEAPASVPVRLNGVQLSLRPLAPTGPVVGLVFDLSVNMNATSALSLGRPQWLDFVVYGDIGGGGQLTLGGAMTSPVWQDVLGLRGLDVTEAALELSLLLPGPALTAVALSLSVQLDRATSVTLRGRVGLDSLDDLLLQADVDSLSLAALVGLFFKLARQQPAAVRQQLQAGVGLLAPVEFRRVSVLFAPSSSSSFSSSTPGLAVSAALLLFGVEFQAAVRTVPAQLAGTALPVVDLQFSFAVDFSSPDNVAQLTAQLIGDLLGVDLAQLGALLQPLNLRPPAAAELLAVDAIAVRDFSLLGIVAGRLPVVVVNLTIAGQPHSFRLDLGLDMLAAPLAQLLAVPAADLPICFRNADCPPAAPLCDHSTPARYTCVSACPAATAPAADLGCFLSA